MIRGADLAAVVFLGTMALDSAARDPEQERRPTLSVKATPIISFSPARIHFTAELKGGPDDFEDFYCPTVEWDWGDGTRSESTSDCEPYEPGRSEIKRVFTTDRIFRMAGNYRVQFRLKKKNRPLIAASTTIQIRAGFRDQTIGN